MNIYKSTEDNVYIENSDGLCMLFDITKSTDQGLVSGWANIAVEKDGTLPIDWQDDIITAETLEKAAIDFMVNFRASGVMHTGESKGSVVESIVFTKEKQKTLGIPEGILPEGWFITVKIHDMSIFEMVKSGHLRMFSIQGRAKRTKIQ